MARPNILRADTLDLQDQHSPTAAEHTKHPAQDANAPHLAASVQHVLDERHSEEKNLQDAWDISANLDDQPKTSDAADANDAKERVQDNGQHGEDGAAGEGEGEGDDDMMDRISSSPSIEDAEDIDFEFVYALHTFVATVEGQANATKGDTMVLLDDSNSYWWLVRVVKDSSIGYLPAEHIETPTERLARLNKHRNIDLSATMLSDNSEKSRNPLKKAMRRRNAKTVQFAAPTYVEASDYEYSTEDEDNMIEPAYGNAQQGEDTAQEEADAEAEKAKKAELEHPEAERRSSTGSNRASFDREQAATAQQALAEAGVTDGVHGPKTGELSQQQHGIDALSIPMVATEAAPLKSSKRSRNTDSFLKDDKLDTVRITLTPGLLREEQARDGKSPSIEMARSSSFEEAKPTSSASDSAAAKKDERKKKEDKPKKSGGMLSGLFKSKKKDKKMKESANDADSEKGSTELQREGSQRSISGLSGKLSPSPADKNVASPLVAPALDHHEQDPISPQAPQDIGPASFVAELEGSNVAYEMASNSPENDVKPLQQVSSSDEPEERAAQSPPPSEKASGISKPLARVQNSVAPFTNMLLGDKEGKPTKAKKSKQRVELDDFDSPVDDPTNPFEDQDNVQEGDRLSESPVEASNHTFMHGTESIHIPDVYREEDAEEGNDEVEGPRSLTSSPSLINQHAEPSGHDSDTSEDGDNDDDDDESTPTARSPLPMAPQEKAAMAARDAALGKHNSSKSSFSQRSPASSRPSPTISQQSWSDDSLKAWMEDSSEVRDMLVMINDTTGVTPVAADHPMMADLFVQEKKDVQDMMGQLDGLLEGYLRRKGVQF
ncbi:uncharacterized protein SEPMUDRAFT_39007 [Sphaerulina musiva SO2202]|uniref:SH3 domain-containing protein n=1 Tax=Sphaerulina musiva (strain SO2202) TaxID=692275 RepID=M3DDW4_SPHMS|nr:uncharacterized protein SEPMUDRAFT_39007 [Sphaerulina musiva SO2202]EMF15910.1 hypothetical protein SEPMUDRAFT_39007 [Sphaerulina musiva SO2202]